MSHKLLLADDSVTIQRVIELTFADEDVQLTAVGDGRLAIERIQADPPDIVLADVGMPEKDGYEVAAFIKNDPRYAHIPVLLLTGAFEPVDEDRARAVGCDGVLAKPFEPQMVITRVKELLAEASRPVPLHRAAAGPAGVPAADLPVAEGLDAVMDGTSLTFVPTMLPSTFAPERPVTPFVAEEPAPQDEPTAADEPFVIESALDAAIRIRRRQTMALSDFGVPPNPVSEPPQVEVDPEADTPVPGRRPDLDDYFRQLDTPGLGLVAPPAAEPVQENVLDLGWAPPGPDTSDTVRLPLDVFGDLSGAPFGGVVPVPPPAADPFEMPAPPPEPRAAVSEALALELLPPSDPPSESPSESPAVAPAVAPAAPAFAQAFSALLAAESGETSGSDLPFFGPVSVPAVDTDALAARVTQQVLEHMTDRVVRETVADIVSRVAERLVREEIERIRASIR